MILNYENHSPLYAQIFFSPSAPPPFSHIRFFSTFLPLENFKQFQLYREDRPKESSRPFSVFPRASFGPFLLAKDLSLGLLITGRDEKTNSLLHNIVQKQCLRVF